MNKEQIEKIALEMEQETSLKSHCFTCYKTDETVVEFATRFLARIDAERGREGAVACVDSRERVTWLTLDNMAGEELFLHPQPPDGYALVPIEPSATYLQSIREAVDYAKRISADEAGIVHQAILTTAKGMK